MPAVIANVKRHAFVIADEHANYRDAGQWFADDGTTGHGRGEYVKPAHRSIHSNPVKSYFSIFKGGVEGVYQR